MLADAHISSLGYLWSNSVFTVLFAYVVFFLACFDVMDFRCRLADYLDIGHLEKRFPESII